MAYTFAEKVLAHKAGLESVVPGQIVTVRPDKLLTHDNTAAISKQFRKIGVDKVADPNINVIVLDHVTPAANETYAQSHRETREFVREQGISAFYDVGEGICHQVLIAEGHALPGSLIVGSDSHTCTYGALGAFSTGVGSTDLAAAMVTGELWFKVPESLKFIYRGRLRPWVGGKDLILHTIGEIGVDGALYKAIEFNGETISRLPMTGRFTMANMAIEAGAKNGIFLPDRITEQYVKDRAMRAYRFYESDKGATYSGVREFDVSLVEPQVSFPHLPSNAKGISEVGKVLIDQAFIGSCTNGWLDDLRTAADVLKGHKISSNVRMIVIPATPSIYRQALTEGLFEIFLDAGAVISPPTCGPCLGGHMGVLAKGERAIANTNRNFVGRMGHPESEVYLSNPAVAAASAVLGRIGGPEELGLRE